ncbi:hypothetical protein EPUL_006621 [Erysiphe pulchra]|uniref:CCHC-type domain-containing protein n=1 Tax=Erysiphe pulchra TaxID=225359 RepID=A0A2S4PKD2_9PEZI|nr:hypothetical protein EPUL_006621 [Erysiphe pulchra]
MAGNVPEEVVDVLGELAKVTDATQFLSGVQRNPELVFEAVKTLADQSIGDGTAASQLESSYKKLIEKEKELLTASNNLEAARKDIEALKKSSENNVFEKLTNVLENLQFQSLRSAKVKEGSIFNGDKTFFPTWKEGILLKLRSNADHYPTEQSKMAFVYSMLNTDCQAHLHGSIKNGILNFDSLESMMIELTVLFDDPNRIRDAIARLHSNFQKNKSFSSWIAEIRRDAAIAGYENSRELRNIVFLNINLELQQALIFERDIYSLEFNDAIARLQDIDNRIQTFSRNMARLRSQSNNNIMPKNMQLPSRPLTTTQGGDAMDLSAASVGPRTPLSDDEKNRRRQLGLCFYCGKKGHRVERCFLKLSNFNKSDNSEEALGKMEVRVQEN